MKLLTTSVAGLMLVLSLVASGRVEARAQLEEEGLAIYGCVMRPGTREPVAGAQVLLLGPDENIFERLRGEKRRTVTTDATGRFAFTGLPAGTNSQQTSRSMRVGSPFGQEEHLISTPARSHRRSRCGASELRRCPDT